jgi:NHLM bacteriocin system ABC transporter peptidase/ATP-binding protein
MEAVECGAASLGILLAHHGRVVPLAELRRECGVSRDGSNAGSLLRAARRYGLDAHGYSKDVEAVRALEPPYIVFWNFNHFLVVEGFGRDRVYLNDPAVGHRTVSLEEFEDAFTGVVLTASPGPEFQRGGRPPSVVRALRERLRGSKGALAFAILAGFLLVLPGLVIPAFTQVFLDEVLIQGRDDWLRPLLGAMLVTAVAYGLLRALQLHCLRRLGLGLSARMSTGFFRHLLELPVDFYSQRYSGEISDRNDLNDSVASVLSGQLARTAIDVVMMLFYAALMMFYDVTLTSIGIGFAALNFIALRKLSRWRVEANMRLLQEQGKLAGTSIAGLQGMETIKASGMESGFFNRWSGYYANATNARQGIELPDQALSRLPGFLSSLATMFMLVLGGLYVIEGRLTIGMLVAFQMLMASFLRPVGSLVELGTTMQELRGDLARLDDVLRHPRDPNVVQAEEEPTDDPDLHDRVRLGGRLEIRGLSFGYSPCDPPLIQDLDLLLEPGQRVALVGGSGSGKSTLAKLVCGLYQPWSGEILFDGRSRREIPPALLCNSLSLVDQDLLLFGGTVRENLTLWDPTVPDEVLERACADAEILERVRSLAGGLKGELSEGGTNLSGGERQRLEIARALVNDPSILVLDEATSALDTESERLIVERITLRGCTCLIVAHRLSTVRDCDEILVLERGVVVERGTHDELWRKGGAYADLVRTEETEAERSPA